MLRSLKMRHAKGVLAARRMAQAVQHDGSNHGPSLAARQVIAVNLQEGGSRTMARGARAFDV